MSLVKKATSSFPLRLVSPENLLTYADQIAVETDANGNMTKSQAQLNAELAALAAAGGGTGEPTGPGFTLALGTQANNYSGLTLNGKNELSINPGDGLRIDSGTGKLSLKLGSGVNLDEDNHLCITLGTGLKMNREGVIYLNLAEGFSVDESGALVPPTVSPLPGTGTSATLIIQ